MARKPWNKGLTKTTHPSLRKTSETMKSKGLDNFKEWRAAAKERGFIKKANSPLTKNGDLAELLGVILGDGNIYKFERTEGLRIVGNSNHHGFIERYAYIVEKVFNKKPHVAKRRDSSASNITFYQKDISKRLGIPTGSKRCLDFKVPSWIIKEKRYVIRFLRGLFESDGNFSEHQKTYTYKAIFTNRNESLLNIVYRLLKKLGFHPHRSKYKVQVSKKEEVKNLKNLLQFRHYS